MPYLLCLFLSLRTVTCAVSSRSFYLWMVTSWSSVRFLMWCSSHCPSHMHQRFTGRPCSRHRSGPAQENSTLTGCMQTSSHSVDSLLLLQIAGCCLICGCVCRNKNSVESLSRLVIHPHQGSIYSACFSHDGTKIAASGAYKTLKAYTFPLSQLGCFYLYKLPCHCFVLRCLKAPQVRSWQRSRHMTTRCSAVPSPLMTVCLQHAPVTEKSR